MNGIKFVNRQISEKGMKKVMGNNGEYLTIGEKFPNIKLSGGLMFHHF